MASSATVEEADLDTFKRLDITALKQYLKKRNQAVTGKKEMLAARAFACQHSFGSNINRKRIAIRKRI